MALPLASFRAPVSSGTASVSRRKPWGTATLVERVSSFTSATVVPFTSRTGTAFTTQRIWRTW